jgi:mannose-6-phosphate isomerase-like protein (cupin superfamily)
MQTAGGGWLSVTPGEKFRIRTPAQDTDGAYAVLEFVVQPKNAIPMHIHQNEEEHFIVIEGTLRMAVGGKPLDVLAGTAVTAPKGVPHAWCNLTDSPVRMLVVFTPGHLEGLFRAVTAKATWSSEDLMELGNSFGIRFVGPPLIDDAYTIVSPRL